MTLKKGYFVSMHVLLLVFVLLFFMNSWKGEAKLVEKSLRKVMKKMEPTGETANTKRVQRSLAIHILADHTKLMACFQSGKFDEMNDVWGDVPSTNEVEVWKIEDGERGDQSIPLLDIWNTLYIEKQREVQDAASYELRIYADHITLEDFTGPDPLIDCKSTETFKFKIIALDENGKIISNQDYEGDRDRFHSRACPWG